MVGRLCDAVVESRVLLSSQMVYEGFGPDQRYALIVEDALGNIHEFFGT
jgi:hypothetical protein